MTIALKGDYVTEDRRLDRIPQWDDRNEAYSVPRLLGAPPLLKTVRWRIDRASLLDQGREGACVSTGFGHDAKADPVRQSWLTMDYCRSNIYHPAQRIDPWPGGSYPDAQPIYEGTSVLAGAKCAQAIGFFGTYGWALNTTQMIQALQQGPVVIGVDWTEGQARPKPNGLIRVEGITLGGHCVCVVGINFTGRLRGQRLDEPYFVIAQSWGRDHGDKGFVYLPLSDMDRLFDRDGECCVPLDRKRVRKGTPHPINQT